MTKAQKISWVIVAAAAVAALAVWRSASPVKTRTPPPVAAEAPAPKAAADPVAAAIAPPPAPANAEPAPPPLVGRGDPLVHRRAAEAAGDYLLRVLDDKGLFLYRVDPFDAKPLGQYNWLRHAGTVYSLCELYQATGTEKYRDGARRAAQRLLAEVQPVTIDGKQFQALVSDPAFTGSGKSGRVVKSGGNALGILALISVERAFESREYKDTALELARYLRFTQQKSGGILSKYLLDKGAFAAWRSSYYPGETLVAWGVLEQRYPQPANRAAIVSLLLNLAPKWQKRIAAEGGGGFDHWGMIGVRHSFEFITDQDLADAPGGWTREGLLKLAIDYCNLELRGQETTGKAITKGSFQGRLGMATPTSIRIEGVQAVARLLEQQEEAVRQRHAESVAHWQGRLWLSHRFITWCQYREDEADQWTSPVNVAGAIRAGISQRNSRSRLVQIDHSQHAISALLGL